MHGEHPELENEATSNPLHNQALVMGRTAEADTRIGDLPMHMPAARDTAAEDIRRTSHEGLPGDPKAGPGLLAVEIAVIVGVLLLVAIGVSVTIGWELGVVVLALGLVGLFWNPVIGTTILRIRDRRDVAELEDAERSGTAARIQPTSRPR
ncbi:MAG TPA: hypothetical protein PL072_04145 [Phycisphaerales bacterium]|nr:hypothetical protein [Phycisphaerales bacterium]